MELQQFTELLQNICSQNNANQNYLNRFANFDNQVNLKRFLRNNVNDLRNGTNTENNLSKYLFQNIPQLLNINNLNLIENNKIILFDNDTILCTQKNVSGIQIGKTIPDYFYSDKTKNIFVEFGHDFACQPYGHINKFFVDYSKIYKFISQNKKANIKIENNYNEIDLQLENYYYHAQFATNVQYLSDTNIGFKTKRCTYPINNDNNILTISNEFNQLEKSILSNQEFSFNFPASNFKLHFWILGPFTIDDKPRLTSIISNHPNNSQLFFAKGEKKYRNWYLDVK